ncbi:MAG TPA: hypothetical protein VJP88_08895, partial [Caulobacteraceae bacterium]|nr:hypothetical protein [Caulobacteraceae bacterium]
MNQSLATMLVSAAPAAVALLPTDLTPHAAMWSKLIDTGSDLAANLAVAMLILLMTIWIGRWTQRL